MKFAIGIFRLPRRGGLEDHALRIADEPAQKGLVVAAPTHLSLRSGWHDQTFL